MPEDEAEGVDYSEYPHAQGEDVLLLNIRGAINRAVKRWKLTTPQVMGVLDLTKLRVWAQMDEVPTGTEGE